MDSIVIIIDYIFNISNLKDHAGVFIWNSYDTMPLLKLK